MGMTQKCYQDTEVSTQLKCILVGFASDGCSNHKVIF